MGFWYGVLVGIIIGVGGTFLILVARARAMVKKIMKDLSTLQKE